MAKLSKNGNLSGTVGNVIFVNNGKYQYVRAKPKNVKQSQKSKDAASLFGWISAQDKKYRDALTASFSFGKDRYYAARHRSRMTKSLLNSKESNTTSPSLTNGTPEALIGFDFNESLPWNTTFRCYTQFSINENGTVACKIPTLLWNEQINPPKGAKSAVLTLTALTTDPDQKVIKINPIASHTISLTPEIKVPETIWTFETPNENAWLIVIGYLGFSTTDNNQAPHLCESTAYLWAKGIKTKIEF